MQFLKCYNKDRKDVTIMKKTASFLPKLNICASFIHLLFFVLMYTDMEIFGEPFVAIFIWSTPFVGAIALLFIIRTVIIALKNKKLPDSFGHIVSYLFTVIFLCVTGWFVYSFLDAWFLF